jgi:hypothetical protein
MVIARKPDSKLVPMREHAADKFIAAAGMPPPTAEPAQEEPTPGNGGRRQPAMIRFDRALLARVDRAAKRRGISRSAWIQYVVSQVLDEEERDIHMSHR